MVTIKRKHLYLAGIVVALIVIAGLFASYTGLFVADGSSGKYDDFAKCLSSKGVVMYGSQYCPHCANQKKAFGDSFRYVTYVECSQQEQLCNERGITGVPAWIIDGKMYTGEQTLQKLSELSGCPLS